MDVTPTIIIIWVCVGACIAVGLGMLGVAVCGLWSRGAEPRQAVGAVRSHTCPCCGYDISGLEEDLCPECGMPSAAGGVRRDTRIRLACAAIGIGLLLAAGLGPWVDRAARHGVIQAAPSEALAIVAQYVPSIQSEAIRQLLSRADAYELTGAGRKQAARLAMRALLQSSDIALRRPAAELLATTADVAPEGAIDALLRDRDFEVRLQGVRALAIAAAGSALAMSEKVGMVARLGRIALSDRSDRVRRTAVDAIGDMGGVGPRVRVLVSALGDSSRTVRIRAIFALARQRVLPVRAMLAISMRLLDTEPDVRTAALMVVKRTLG